MFDPAESLAVPVPRQPDSTARRDESTIDSVEPPIVTPPVDVEPRPASAHTRPPVTVKLPVPPPRFAIAGKFEP